MTADEFKKLFNEKLPNWANMLRAVLLESDMEFETGDIELGLEEYDCDDYVKVLNKVLGENHHYEFILEGLLFNSANDYQWIWKFGEQYFKIDGYYTSEEGRDMDSILDFYEVVPEKKTFTYTNYKSV